MATTAADVLCAAPSSAAARRTSSASPGRRRSSSGIAPCAQPGLTSVVPTNELTGSFMAIGHARASGRPGRPVDDRRAGLHVRAHRPCRGAARLRAARARRRSADQARGRRAGAPVDRPARDRGAAREGDRGHPGPDSVADAVDEAFDLAIAGEPGPVLGPVRAGHARGAAGARVPPTSRAGPAGPDVDEVVARLLAARRPVLLCGLGARRAATDVARIAEAPARAGPHDDLGPGRRLRASSTQPRPRRARRIDGGARRAPGRSGPRPLHRLQALAQRQPRVPAPPAPGDARADRRVAGRDGPSLPRVARARRGRRVDLVRRRRADVAAGAASEWTEEDVTDLRRRLAEVRSPLPEPTVAGGTPAASSRRFGTRCPTAPSVTADSGLHQFLLRAHFPVLAPGTLLVPANYQSMGFGIPAAIGAALATGERTVAVVGDGGLNIAGFELLTAARGSARDRVRPRRPSLRADPRAAAPSRRQRIRGRHPRGRPPVARGKPRRCTRPARRPGRRRPPGSSTTPMSCSSRCRRSRPSECEGSRREPRRLLARSTVGPGALGDVYGAPAAPPQALVPVLGRVRVREWPRRTGGSRPRRSRRARAARP